MKSRFAKSFMVVCICFVASNAARADAVASVCRVGKFVDMLGAASLFEKDPHSTSLIASLGNTAKCRFSAKIKDCQEVALKRLFTYMKLYNLDYEDKIRVQNLKSILSAAHVTYSYKITDFDSDAPKFSEIRDANDVNVKVPVVDDQASFEFSCSLGEMTENEFMAKMGH